MDGWQGWIAALGGLLAILSTYIGGWALWVGGIVAIVAGIWASMGK